MPIAGDNVIIVAIPDLNEYRLRVGGLAAT
jgi:hypothetical protein